MIHLKKYHAKKIKDKLSTNLIHVQVNDEEHIYHCYDLKNRKNFYILLIKDNKIKVVIDFFDLEFNNKDSRHIFTYLRQISPSCEVGIALDFDKEHDNNKNIHLNIRVLSKKNSMIDFSKMNELDHLRVSFFKDKNFTQIDHFKTLLNIIEKLGENGFLSNFEKYAICQLDINSSEYSKLNVLLKKFLKNQE